MGIVSIDTRLQRFPHMVSAGVLRALSAKRRLIDESSQQPQCDEIAAYMSHRNRTHATCAIQEKTRIARSISARSDHNCRGRAVLYPRPLGKEIFVVP
jgi:hypothetical protein